MLKQAAYFLAFFLFLAGAFVIGERSISPVFKSCIEQDKNTDAKTTAEKNQSTFEPAISAYVECSGEFIEAHDGAITALATIIIAAFTGTLWVATSSQGKLTKEALIADKRAFVFAAGITPCWESDPVTNNFNWRIRPIWQNSGDTPTKRMRLYVACEVRNTQLPKGFDFNQTITLPGPGMLGPKASNMGGAAPVIPAAPIMPQDILDAQNGRKFIYLWGWARYFDVFPRTPEHITRFCWLILVAGDPLSFTPAQPNSIIFANLHHSEGNCADEECPLKGPACRNHLNHGRRYLSSPGYSP